MTAGIGPGLAAALALQPVSIAGCRASRDAGMPCGDWVGWAVEQRPDGPLTWLAVVDGLGHGAPAAEAADRAARHLEAAWQSGGTPIDPPALLHGLHAVLVRTRGAAAAVACVHRGRLRHAGIGNTRCLVWVDGRTQRLPSGYGIVGEPPPTWPREEACALTPGAWVVLCTDGLDERFQLGLAGSDRQLPAERVCERLMQRWRNPRDDAAVLALRLGG